jgi:predicted transcriptional regulator
MTTPLRLARVAAGITQHQLSRTADIPVALVARVESGKSPRPSWFVVRRLSWALGKAPEELFPVPLPDEPTASVSAPDGAQAPAA